MSKSVWRRLNLLVPPPIVTVLAGLLMWLAERSLEVGSFAFPQQQEVALAIWMLGGLLMVWAIAAFISGKTTVNPLKPHYASQLLTTGVFAFSRNPIYLADLLLLLGWLVWLGNVLTVVVMALFVAYITVFQIIPEERILHKMFGDRYTEYYREVRRWI